MSTACASAARTGRARRSTTLAAGLGVAARGAPRRPAASSCTTLGAQLETGATPSSAALILVAPLGFDVTTVAAVERLDATRTVGIDLMIDDAATKRRVLATNPGHAARHARRRACAVRARRQGRQRDPRQRRLRHAARDRHHRQHRDRHVPAARVLAGRSRDRGAAGPGLSAGTARDGRPLRPDQHAGSAVQPADRLRRSALSPEPLAAPPRRARPEPCTKKNRSTDR